MVSVSWEDIIIYLFVIQPTTIHPLQLTYFTLQIHWKLNLLNMVIYSLKLTKIQRLDKIIKWKTYFITIASPAIKVADVS